MHGHLEAVRDRFGVIEAGRIFEVEVVVGRRVVVEVIANEEDLLDGGMQRVDEVASGGVTRGGDEDALVVFDAVLGAFDVEVVDDVGVGDEGEIELVRRGSCPGLLSPELPSEQATEGCSAEGGELSTIKFSV
jgi:hypothetical protein